MFRAQCWSVQLVRGSLTLRRCVRWPAHDVCLRELDFGALASAAVPVQCSWLRLGMSGAVEVLAASPACHCLLHSRNRNRRESHDHTDGDDGTCADGVDSKPTHNAAAACSVLPAVRCGTFSTVAVWYPQRLVGSSAPDHCEVRLDQL